MLVGSNGKRIACGCQDFPVRKCDRGGTIFTHTPLTRSPGSESWYNWYLIFLAFSESSSSVKVDPDIFAGVIVGLNGVGK